MDIPALLYVYMSGAVNGIPFPCRRLIPRSLPHPTTPRALETTRASSSLTLICFVL